MLLTVFKYVISGNWPTQKESKERRKVLQSLKRGHRVPGRGGGGDPHMKEVGMLIGNFELNPKRRPIWAWPKPFLTPKRDHVKTQTIYVFLYFFACNPKRDLHG